MKYFVLIAAMLSCLTWESQAYAHTEPRDDAAYIAEALYNDDVIEVSFSAMGELMGYAMIAEFKKQGIEVTTQASEVIAAMLLDGLLEIAGPEMRSLYADAYRRQYTEGELKAYRSFLESEAGQRIAIGNSEFIRDTTKRAEAVGMNLDVTAAERMIENIAVQYFPEGTNSEVIKEIESLYGGAK